MLSAWTYCLVGLLILRLGTGADADVAHYFTPVDFGSFVHGQHPYQVGLAPPQPSTLYGAPINPVTPAPVAPPAPATTEFTLPEIIENRSVKTHGNFIPLSQHYLPPAEERPSYESPKPVPSDEAFAGYYYPSPSSTTTSTTQRPIVVQDPGDDNDLEAGYDYHAPVLPSTPAPVYLPPEQPSSENQQLRLRLKEMRCLQGGYFRTILKVDSFISTAPTVDTGDAQDKRCELKLSRSYLLLDIAGADFERCGVRSCGKDLCLRLRFPAIRGLRTAGDAILTLHCKTQERVAVKTHALKMGVASDVQARSSGTYAHGGLQNAFRTHVELLRRGSNGYTRHLENNGAVQLGEDLLLRAHVLAGDGWNYTKLSDVQLQRISPSGDLLNSAQLVTPQGCLNPAMQSICAHAPSFEAPLGQRLHFKAVMFQGMRSGDVLIMSMRITGCLEREDCQLTAQDCVVGGTQRRRRDTTGQGNGTEASELSHITFRVILPEATEERSSKEEEQSNEHVADFSKSLALGGSLGFVILLLGLGIVAAYKLGK
ncbi:uncharacterized protein LOC115624908 [Scaptodrosophila lebanonensis]|uniref:Uncharacterized protein LOC115624908 n=1 Tax=Drosophila lebanonensis TaxID=7225 RepID=A0A6J2TFV3_DROLE|nr:uncharacterized protein LOC115624908 [Scaptodrosophila lebanonensis]